MWRNRHKLRGICLTQNKCQVINDETFSHVFLFLVFHFLFSLFLYSFDRSFVSFFRLFNAMNDKKFSLIIFFFSFIIMNVFLYFLAFTSTWFCFHSFIYDLASFFNSFFFSKKSDKINGNRIFTYFNFFNVLFYFSFLIFFFSSLTFLLVSHFSLFPFLSVYFWLVFFSHVQFNFLCNMYAWSKRTYLIQYFHFDINFRWPVKW